VMESVFDNDGVNEYLMLREKVWDCEDVSEFVFESVLKIEQVKDVV
jgi:hypothetical protein